MGGICLAVFESGQQRKVGVQLAEGCMSARTLGLVSSTS